MPERHGTARAEVGLTRAELIAREAQEAGIDGADSLNARGHTGDVSPPLQSFADHQWAMAGPRVLGKSGGDRHTHGR